MVRYWFLILMVLCCGCAWCKPSGEAYLFVLDNGQVIYERDSRKSLPMASTTKLMTALIAAEKQWDDITMTHEALSTESANMQLRAGDTMSRADALSAMLMKSSNETAAAVSQLDRDFVVEMNCRAKNLGMTDTAYRNPHGLDTPGHYSSCRDIVILAQEVMKIPELRNIVSCPQKDILINGREKRKIKSTFAGFLRNVPGAVGIKTGTTTMAGSCFAGAVRVKKHLLYCVILRSYKGKAYVQAAKEIKNILADCSLVTAVRRGRIYQAGKDFDNIKFEAREGLELLLAKDARLTARLRYTPKYPVRRGDTAAFLMVRAPGYNRDIPLYAAENRLLPRIQMLGTVILIILACAALIYYFWPEKADRFPTLH